MVIDVRQVRDARTLNVSFHATLLQMGTQNVAHRLTARRIATLLDELIESGGQFFIERYGEAIHSISESSGILCSQKINFRDRVSLPEIPIAGSALRLLDQHPEPLFRFTG